MQVKLHQDVEGKRAGDVVTVDKERGEFLVLNGYASKSRGKGEDMHLATTVEADADPTSKENREEPDEFDAAQAEDESTNDEATKRAEVEESLRTKKAPATQKRETRAKKAPAAAEEPSEG